MTDRNAILTARQATEIDRANKTPSERESYSVIIRSELERFDCESATAATVMPERYDLMHSPLGWVVAAVLLAALGVIAVLAAIRRRKRSVPAQRSGCKEIAIQAASLQNIGRRETQQDCFGVFCLSDDGILAVVADGMGGLRDGDAVSKKIVETVESHAVDQSYASLDGSLPMLVSDVNDAVNRMLGHDGLYQSGSTLAIVLAGPDRFQCASVGDSRICLYRGGKLIQLNREHDYEAELMLQAINREISFEDAKSDPRRGGLSSFLGMGELRYVDLTRRPIDVCPGDRVLLMSDGVFRTVSDSETASILCSNTDVRQAAFALETAVLKRENPRQDNFTAVILGYDA